MCLGIPMQIVSIDGLRALAEVKGVAREVSLFLLQDQALAPGDFVLVHVGYAIQKVDPAMAREAWALYDELVAG